MATKASTSAARSRSSARACVVVRRRQLFEKQVFARKLADDRRAARSRSMRAMPSCIELER